MLIVLTVILTQFFWSINGYANPQGLSPTTDATISTSGTTETITQSVSKAILDWNSFSIAAGETTQFVQPSSSSVALNRVVGSSPSDIFGTLKANGQVFLINKNGILFAPGSQVNVGGLIASTLDISNKQFLRGTYHAVNSNGQAITVQGYVFNGAKGFGSVVNQGTINVLNAPGGYAALLGSNVENTGAIITTAGSVALASGNKIAINLDTSGAISAVLVQKALASNISGSVDDILNSGTITANGGRVILTAKSLQGLFTNLINNEGIIEANSLSNQNGVIELTADGGDIIAKSGSVISAKAGDSTSQGGNITLNSTNNITIENGAVLDVSGGSLAGNGGNIDVVTQGNLDFEGTLNGFAAKGYSMGTANLDPATATVSGMYGLNTTVWATGNITIVGNATIDGSLNIFADNTDGTAGSYGGGAGGITDTGKYTISGGGSGILNLEAGSGGMGSSTAPILVNGLASVSAAIDPLGSGNIYITDMTDDLNVGAINAGNGSVNLTATSGSILDTGSLITGNVVSLTAVGGIGTSAKAINTRASTINARVSGGLININQTGNVALGNVRTGTGGGATDSITLTSSGNIDAGTVSAAGGLADVHLNSAASITDNTGGTITANNLSLVANNDIGSSTNRINTNANNISARSKDIGNIYLKQTTAVTLSNLFAANGLIDVIADGQITADKIVTAGGPTDSISLQTTFGDIDLEGNISAAGGLGDVTLNSAGNIYDINANSMVTANNLNLSTGINGSSVGLQLFLGAAISNTYVVNGHQVLVIDNQPGAASYNVYFIAYSTTTGQPIGSWQEVASNVTASDGSTTIWTDPSPALIGTLASYYAQVATAATSNIGSSTQRVNTNVNNISGISQDIGNVYLNQAKAVTLSNLNATNGLIDVISAGDMSVGDVNAAGDVTLNSGNGSILGIGGGTNVTSGGNTNLTAGNLIGSWVPYSPLNVNVGKDLYLAIGQRDSSSVSGSVGPMGVSGTIGGTVGGVYHFDPGIHALYNLANTAFSGNPPGYIFLNKVEIWPNLSLPTVVNNNVALAAAQIDNSLQENQNAYYERLHVHLIREAEVASPLNIYAYHSLVDSDNSAVDHIKLEPEAYDYIDQHINLINPLGPALQGEGQKENK